MPTKTNTRVLSEILGYTHEELIDLLKENGLLEALKESEVLRGVYLLNDDQTFDFLNKVVKDTKKIYETIRFLTIQDNLLSSHHQRFRTLSCKSRLDPAEELTEMMRLVY